MHDLHVSMMLQPQECARSIQNDLQEAFGVGGEGSCVFLCSEESLEELTIH